jgi:hypothetical protein
VGWCEDLSLELGLTKDGELQGNTKLQSDLEHAQPVLSECVMRVTGVLGAQLYRLLAPPGHRDRSL